MFKDIVKFLVKKVYIFKVAYRIHYAFGYYNAKLKNIFKWAFKSKEDSTFTYNLNPINLEYLLHTISIITNLPIITIESYYNEINTDSDLEEIILNALSTTKLKKLKDPRCMYGMRIGLYILNEGPRRRAARYLVS